MADEEKEGGVSHPIKLDKDGRREEEEFPGKIWVERFDNHSFTYLGL